MASTLHELLALNASPSTAAEWHELLFNGLPVESLKTLADELGMTDRAAADALTDLQSVPRKGALDREDSNAVYRCAQLLSQARMKHRDAKAAARWMRAPCEALRGRVPLDLCRSHMGYEYALVALARG